MSKIVKTIIRLMFAIETHILTKMCKPVVLNTKQVSNIYYKYNNCNHSNKIDTPPKKKIAFFLTVNLLLYRAKDTTQCIDLSICVYISWHYR